MCSSDLFPSHDTIQLDKNEGKITIDGVEHLDNEESKRTINQAIKNNELKNIELGYPSEKQIKAIKQINAKKREIIATHKVILELKKANESYKHIIQEREKGGNYRNESAKNNTKQRTTDTKTRRRNRRSESKRNKD